MRNKKPYIEVQSQSRSCWEGWNKIADALNSKIKSLRSRKIIITVECYQGTYEDINLRELKKRLPVNATCTSRDVFKDEDEITRQCTKDLSRMPFSASASTHDIEEYFDQNKLQALRQNIEFIEEGIVLIFGVGASKICIPDILVYADMSRWEILQRFKRHDVSNIGVSNSQAAFEQQYRWSYFIDWKICDKIKKQLLSQCDYYLETNNWEKPKLASGEIIREAILQATTQPFFTAPFYDPELWDQRAAEPREEEFSWVFNCVAEENNVLFKISECLIEVPSINVIYAAPKKLLGETVYNHFGSELPIRMVFIDTLDGTQEKLFACPGIDYLKDNFGFYLSQCETFYVMDTTAEAKLRMGFKKSIIPEDLKSLLNKDNTISKVALDKLLNSILLKRHDHINIPAGIAHSHGNNSMILKISAAPEIFTFKLPDDLLELDESSRSLYSEEVKKLTSNILSSGDIDSRYYNQATPLTTAYREEILNQKGDLLNIKRMWFEEPILQKTNNCVQVLNLIEGEEAIVESPDGQFEPFIVHFAESFIIPAGISEYTIRPSKKNKAYGVLKISI
ncbi:mannose-6-phosphate isomerase-like protein [Fulvivirga imtechensis AK7]|uniref:Mannose-6-phosphate isomerase-like protein n=1 Tax=Fulvivirga imtechensis AK7 TaxID=1237149 RepID=L8JT39_9BACT|nr:hypothetical protein [Fulvivirga imtechensis]ELR72141.1 mannose-6-phosphate isomerase-like protein [Fulvivirga imtechensis AK7]